MSDSRERPWSDHPNAPKIPYHLHLLEKANFAGYFIGSILYGMCQARPPARPSTHVTHSICSIRSRNAHRAVLQMCGRAV